MAVTQIHTQTLQFLQALSQNNHREWFEVNKGDFISAQANIKAFYGQLFEQYRQADTLDHFKVYRIYRDVRFSKDKTPYKTHFGGVFHRVKPQHRGTYYLHIEPDNSFVGGGFWAPEAHDLLRIRKEIEADAEPLKRILNHHEFKKAFGGFHGESLKSAPKGFDKNHPDIELIKRKQFIVGHLFTNEEVLCKAFADNVLHHFALLKPFFDYMSEVLTTNLNGETLI